jgi:hypothetical protein
MCRSAAVSADSRVAPAVVKLHCVKRFCSRTSQRHILCRQYTRSVEQPKLYYKAGALSKLVVERCAVLNRAYCPCPWAFSRDFQTCVTGASTINSYPCNRRAGVVDAAGSMTMLGCQVTVLRRRITMLSAVVQCCGRSQCLRASPASCAACMMEAASRWTGGVTIRPALACQRARLLCSCCMVCLVRRLLRPCRLWTCVRAELMH